MQIAWLDRLSPLFYHTGCARIGRHKSRGSIGGTLFFASSRLLAAERERGEGAENRVAPSVEPVSSHRLCAILASSIAWLHRWGVLFYIKVVSKIWCKSRGSIGGASFFASNWCRNFDANRVAPSGARLLFDQIGVEISMQIAWLHRWGVLGDAKARRKMRRSVACLPDAIVNPARRDCEPASKSQILGGSCIPEMVQPRRPKWPKSAFGLGETQI